MKLKVEVYLIVNDRPKTIDTKWVSMDKDECIEDCIKNGERIFERFIKDNPGISKDMLGVKSTLVIW